jgi:hypothetical protein
MNTSPYFTILVAIRLELMNTSPYFTILVAIRLELMNTSPYFTILVAIRLELINASPYFTIYIFVSEYGFHPTAEQAARLGGAQAGDPCQPSLSHRQRHELIILTYKTLHFAKL